MVIITLPIHAAEIRYRLQSYQPSHAVSLFTAKGYLEEKLVTYQLLALYQHFFPEAYQASTTSLYDQYNPEGHRLKEIEAIQTLARVIPVSGWDIERAADGILPGLPLIDMGIDLIDDDGIECLKMPLQLLMPLSQTGRDCLEHVDGAEWYATSFGISLEAIRPPNQINQHHLRQRFNREPAPLRFLPLTLRVMDKTTGNPWLDCTNNEAWFGSECSTIVSWSIPAMTRLIHQWQKATVLLHHVDCFIHWMEPNATEHFHHILTLWNTP